MRIQQPSSLRDKSLRSQRLSSAAERRAVEAQADVKMAWRKLLGPIGLACDRRAWSVAGIAMLVAVPFAEKLGSSLWVGRFAGASFVCFAIATIGALADGARMRPIRRKGDRVVDQAGAIPESELRPAAQKTVPRWLVPLFVVALVAASAVQMLFIGGGALAHADIAPPAGTAWLTSLFSPWNSSNLGSAAAGAMQLPWAAVYGMVHILGGSGALAQRIWLTGLFIGVGAGAVALLSALKFSAPAVIAGGLVYVFSSYVVAFAGTNDVVLTTMGLVPALLAWVVCTARTPRLRWWLVLMALAAMMLGIVAETPPMLLPCAAALIMGPILVGWLYGTRLMKTAIRRTLAGIGVVLAVSAYWAVPYAIQLFSTGAAQGASSRAWQWTEVRSSLANALWLNSLWVWAFPQYTAHRGRFPLAYVQYAPDAHFYEQFPLVFVKYLLPLAAFAALGLAAIRVSRNDASRLRLIGLASGITLLVVLISTGTRFPGSLLFNLLYALPFGYLLQEPNRFLFVAGLGYAILIAIGVEAVMTPQVNGGGSSRFSGHPEVKSWRGPLLSTVGVLVLIAPAWPLVAPSSPGVTVPKYWDAMTSFINRSAPPGNLLVLPEDDFYQMPYTWYYGTDSFINEMISRDVIDPVSQGYLPASAQLINAVALFQESILAHNWQESGDIAQALGAQDILVRGDIESGLPDRSISDPQDIASSLLSDPDVRLFAHAGPLDLLTFRQRLSSFSHLVTVNSRAPDLRLLSLFPPGTALLASAPRSGVPAVIEAPPTNRWTLGDDMLTDTVLLPPGRSYEIASLSSTGASQPVPIDGTVHLGLTTAEELDPAGRPRLVLTEPGGQGAHAVLIIATPASSSPTSIVTNRTEFATHWDGPVGGEHVLVDGLLNAWSGSRMEGKPHYAFNGLVTAVDLTVFFGVLCLMVTLGTLEALTRFRSRSDRRERQSGDDRGVS